MDIPSMDTPSMETSPTDTPAAPAPNRTPHPAAPRLDWQEVAQRLARGEGIDGIAADLATHRERIWRNLKRSSRFRARIREERRRAAEEASNRLHALRGAVSDAIHREVAAGNLRVILWLADRLDIVGNEDRAAWARQALLHPAADRRRLPPALTKPPADSPQSSY